MKIGSKSQIPWHMPILVKTDKLNYLKILTSLAQYSYLYYLLKQRFT